MLNEISMAVPAPGGIEIKYDRKNIVLVIVSFKFRSGVSVQATSMAVLKSDRSSPVPVVVKCKFGSGSELKARFMRV